MKRLIVILFLPLIVYSQRITERDTLSRDLVISRLSEDTWLMAHSFPWPANSLVVRTSQNDFVLVDTPYENEASRLFYEWLQRKFPGAELVVINCHFHVDNLGGNGFFLGNNIPVYGSRRAVELLKEKGFAGTLEFLKAPRYERYRKVFEQLELKPPDHLFNLEEGLTLKYENGEVIVWFPGPGHTEDNLSVYFPAKKMLFGGCLVKSMESKGPGNTRDAVMDKWVESLQNLKNKFADAEMVIPGHGRPGGMELIDHSMKIISEANGG